MSRAAKGSRSCAATTNRAIARAASRSGAAALKRAVLLVAIALAACGTEGAVLELELHLPPAGACGARRAAVRAAFERDLGGAGVCPFESEWASGDCIADLSLGDATSTSRISIVATEDDVAEPLCVRVTFGDSGCSIGALPPGTATIRVDPAFREAGYTEVFVAIADACAIQDLGVLPATPIP